MNIPVTYYRRVLLTTALLAFAGNLVMAAPRIEVDRTEVDMGKIYVPPSFKYASFPATLEEIIIKNVGDELLVVSSFESLSSFSLQPGLSKTISLRQYSPKVGIQAWVAEIKSNDPEFPVIQIPMSYEGIVQPPLVVEDLDGTTFVSGEAVLQLGPCVADPNRAYPTTLPRTVSRIIRVRNTGEASMPIRVNSWDHHGADVVGRSRVYVSPLSVFDAVIIPPLSTLDLTIMLTPERIDDLKSKVTLSSFWHPHPSVREPSFEFFIQTVASGIPRFAVEDGKAYDDWDPESVAPLGFDTMHLGEWQDSSVTIRNDGMAPLTVGAEIVGGDQDDFVLRKSFPVTIEAGASSVVGVRFAPKDGGPRSSTLRFTTDDPDVPQFDIPLQGNGFRLVVEDPEGSDFGGVPVGGLATRTFALENKGVTAISGISAELTSTASGQLSLIGDVPYSLEPGERIEFDVQFAPHQAGSLFSYLKVTTLENLSKPLLLGMTAKGTEAPSLVLSSERGQISTPGMTSMEVPYDSVDIGDYKRFAFDLRNKGTVPMDLSTVFQSGSSADFSLLKPLPDSIAPGGRVRFEITFRPKDSGSKAAVFRIRSNDPDQPEFDILLSGYGFPFSVETPEGTEFGTTELGESEVLSFVLINNGSEPLKQMSALLVDGGLTRAAGIVSTAAVAGSAEFALVSPVPEQLAPNERVTFQVRFKPRSAGDRSVVLRLQSSKNHEKSVEILLKGRGRGVKAPKIVVKSYNGKNLTKGSAAVGFGRIKVGSKATRWFSIRNKEAIPLNISKIAVKGPHSEIFRIAGASNKKIPPGKALRFQVSCKPVDAGGFDATFIIRGHYGPKKKVPAIRIKAKGVASPAAKKGGLSGIGKDERTVE